MLFKRCAFTVSIIQNILLLLLLLLYNTFTVGTSTRIRILYIFF